MSFIFLSKCFVPVLMIQRYSRKNSVENTCDELNELCDKLIEPCENKKTHDGRIMSFENVFVVLFL
jgi:hypothetical protein